MSSAILNQDGEAELPVEIGKVFDAILEAVPTINGMKIDSSDRLLGRILVKSGVSLFSWGENIPIQLYEVSENKTKIKITSAPKTGMLAAGGWDGGKGRKNIEDILSATSRVLQSRM
jgi:hypothetical protein